MKLPGWFELDLELLVAVLDQSMHGLVECIDVLSEGGGQLHNETGRHNLPESGEFAVDWLEAVRQELKQEIQVLQELRAVSPVEAAP